MPMGYGNGRFHQRATKWSGGSGGVVDQKASDLVINSGVSIRADGGSGAPLATGGTIMPPMVVELVRQLVEEERIRRAPIHSSIKAVQPMKIFLPTKVEMQSISFPQKFQD